MDSKTEFEKWNDPQPESFYTDKNNYDLMLVAWQACQELNDKRIAELEKILSFEEPYLITILDEIRSALGGTDKLMLYELAPEITKRIAELESRLKVASDALTSIVGDKALKQLTE